MMDCTDVKNFKPGGVYLQADSETTELSAEAERCTYCGRRGADNCDVPPPDVCEKAIAPEPASSEPTSPLGEQIGGNHYKDMKIQPVEFIHANGIGYIEGCVIKYVSRWRKKGGAEDLKKARHFIDLLLQLENAK